MGHVNPQQEGSPLQAWERLSEDTQTPDLRASASAAPAPLVCGVLYSSLNGLKEGCILKRVKGTHVLSLTPYYCLSPYAAGGF